MASPKQTFDVQLTTDQIAFMRSMKKKFQIVDDSKTFRVVIDYLMTNKDVYDDVFGKTRCFRCD